MSGGQDAWERVAEVAGGLFLRRGYAAVSLSQIAAELGMKAGSLYHHCAGGKAELYVRSLEHTLRDYRATLEGIGEAAEFPDAIYEMATWMLIQPPIDVRRIVEVDLPAVQEGAPALAHGVVAAIHDSVFGPLKRAFDRADEAGLLHEAVDTGVAAAAAVALVDGLGAAHTPNGQTADEQTMLLVRGGLELLVRGTSRDRP